MVEHPDPRKLFPVYMTLRELAQELLDIQHGSIEDATALAEDYLPIEDQELLIEYIEELGSSNDD